MWQSINYTEIEVEWFLDQITKKYWNERNSKKEKHVKFGILLPRMGWFTDFKKLLEFKGFLKNWSGHD